MSTLLIVLLILTIGSIFWLIIDLIKDYKQWAIPLSILIVTVFFGWFIMGVTIPQITKNVEITSPVEIMKSSTIVFIEINEKKWEFDNHKDYISINDSTKFYYEIGYNLYNSEVSRQLKYNN